VVVPPTGVECSYYRYTVYVRPELLRPEWSRDRVMAAINAEGIPCNVGGCSEIYLEKAFSSAMRPANRLPIARELGETALSFLGDPRLRALDLSDTVAAVEKVISVASD
jgi:dTDP-4-amino-4,6-dideoxygalactose transaminase